MGHGKEFKAAIVSASSWATAVTCGAGHGIPLKTSDFGGGAESVPNETATGYLWGDPNRMGNKRFAFPITVEGKYRGLEALVALALGSTGGTPTTIEAGVFQQDAVVTSGSMPFGTYVEDKSAALWELDNFKVSSMTLRGERGGPLEVTAQLIGRDVAYGTGVNDSSTFASVTIPSGNLAFFTQGRFRMNAQGGATLATNIAIDSFEITIDNASDQESFRADGTNSLVIAEPDREGTPSVRGSFSLAEYSANTYRAMRDAGTAQKMEILFTGSTLIGATKYPEIRIQCPYIQLPEDDPTMSGPGRVPESITFDAFPVSSAPTGMTITEAIQIRLQSTLSTDPLTGNT